ncbi:hypothetical protein [Pseudorhodobacter antarcticus]|jgi:hypothetical protein|uniref:hypothetical protein n=1 Tax=Pseudorhodobacter antarcticus TaxID=1077947 RepID=UPI00067D566D|nr:hypothetical protein [Pseudorhodobacter antarcticus]
MVGVLGAQGGNIQSDLPSIGGAGGRVQGRTRAQNTPFSHVPLLHINISGKIKHVRQPLDPKGGRNSPPLWDKMKKTVDAGDSFWTMGAQARPKAKGHFHE